jgi:hypothetical protein
MLRIRLLPLTMDGPDILSIARAIVVDFSISVKLNEWVGFIH